MKRLMGWRKNVRFSTFLGCEQPPLSLKRLIYCLLSHRRGFFLSLAFIFYFTNPRMDLGVFVDFNYNVSKDRHGLGVVGEISWLDRCLEKDNHFNLVLSTVNFNPGVFP